MVRQCVTGSLNRSSGLTWCHILWLYLSMGHEFFHWAMTDIRQDASFGCIRGDPVYADTPEYHHGYGLASSPHLVRLFFLCWKLLRFILLSNFRICNAGITNYRPQATCHIPGTYLFYNHKLIPSDRFTHFTHSPAFGSLLSVLSVSGSIGWFLDSVWKWEQTVLVFLCVTYPTSSYLNIN